MPAALGLVTAGGVLGQALAAVWLTDDGWWWLAANCIGASGAEALAAALEPRQDSTGAWSAATYLTKLLLGGMAKGWG